MTTNNKHFQAHCMFTRETKVKINTIMENEGMNPFSNTFSALFRDSLTLSGGCDK